MFVIDSDENSTFSGFHSLASRGVNPDNSSGNRIILYLLNSIGAATSMGKEETKGYPSLRLGGLYITPLWALWSRTMFLSTANCKLRL
jgi:hypothetical protein